MFHRHLRKLSVSSYGGPMMYWAMMDIILSYKSLMLFSIIVSAVYLPHTLLMDDYSRQGSEQNYSHTHTLLSVHYPDTTLSEPGDCISSGLECIHDDDMYPAYYSDEPARSDRESSDEFKSSEEVYLVCKLFHIITLYICNLISVTN